MVRFSMYFTLGEFNSQNSNFDGQGPQWLNDEEIRWPQWKQNEYEERINNEEYENEDEIYTATATTKLITKRRFQLIDATHFSK